MKNLLYKEFKLAVHPSMVIFLFFGAFLLIPSWPYFIAFGYLFIGIMNMFIVGRANQDVFFTAGLPVRKSDVVRARVLVIVLFELMQIAAAVPFACLNPLINPHGNMAGMNPNVAFFGFVFMMYAVFNFVFFPKYFKTAYKVGGAVVLGVLAVLVFLGAVETAVHLVPWLNTNVNAVGAGRLPGQLLVLAAGIAVYALVTRLAFKRAAARFDKVDL
ncbi:MAG: ABC-2 transporter permease [Spirochaetales bacterium]|nr:ABC-2 transporter permease [Spirochaetales bacterium]